MGVGAAKTIQTHIDMTTFQFILLLCILVATVGLVIYFETKAAQDNDVSPVKIIEEKPLTKENVIKVLTSFGATEIEEDNNGLAFRYQDSWF